MARGECGLVIVPRLLEARDAGHAVAGQTRISGCDGQVAAVLELARQDPELFLHGLSVGRLAEGIALALGLTRPYAARIRLAGTLHDIGKLAVPRSLLSKPGPLTDAERRVIERHPLIGAAVVQLAGLRLEARWIRHHHERMDGLGYPDRLAGHEIPLPSRVILVADAFDVLTSGRPYRPAQTPGDALAELQATQLPRASSSIKSARILLRCFSTTAKLAGTR
jgi:HD-GYP domain-containing protein (c-di-GMP phosphodiesterase class II)